MRRLPSDYQLIPFRIEFLALGFRINSMSIFNYNEEVVALLVSNE